MISMNKTPPFGYAAIPPFAQTPYVPTARDMAMSQALAESEANLQKQRQKMIDDERAKIKQMSNRELLEAIYLKLLGM